MKKDQYKTSNPSLSLQPSPELQRQGNILLLNRVGFFPEGLPEVLVCICSPQVIFPVSYVNYLCCELDTLLVFCIFNISIEWPIDSKLVYLQQGTGNIIAFLGRLTAGSDISRWE